MTTITLCDRGVNLTHTHNASHVERTNARTTIWPYNCENYDFAVLIGFKTLEDAVNYVHDEEFGAKQTAVRLATTEGPLAAIGATNKTCGPFPQYTGVPHDR